MPLQSCPYCGRIHPRGYDCGRKPKRRRNCATEERTFRSSQRWRNMSILIRQRDRYMCVYCWLHDHAITTTDIEVHHIVPITADYDRRLEGANLISLCRYHHEQAEKGLINASLLLQMASKQE